MNIELLAPAGNTEALDAAVNEGADAVYLGLKTFNARMRSSNFAWSQFEAAVDSLHKRNKKVYVTVNTVLTEEETEKMYRFLKYLDSVSPDGIIVQDLGIVQMAKTHFPKLKLHASTQMNIASAKAANALSRFGISRVVLARELSLNASANRGYVCFLHTSEGNQQTEGCVPKPAEDCTRHILLKATKTAIIFLPMTCSSSIMFPTL